MPKKPSLTPKLPKFEDFGTPSSTRLRQNGVVGDAISKIIAVDDAVAKFHHKMVRHGICARVELALAIASDKQAFANFANEARVKALPRPPKDASDTLRCLFQATYPDPKKSSKYYKRIEPLWIKRCSAAEVLEFLEKDGVSKPSPKGSPTSREAGPGKIASATTKRTKISEASAGGIGDRVSATTNESDSPSGIMYFWPGKIKVGGFYDLRVKIVSDDDETSIFYLLDVSPARGQ